MGYLLLSFGNGTLHTTHPPHPNYHHHQHHHHRRHRHHHWGCDDDTMSETDAVPNCSKKQPRDVEGGGKAAISALIYHLNSKYLKLKYLMFKYDTKKYSIVLC